MSEEETTSLANATSVERTDGSDIVESVITGSATPVATTGSDAPSRRLKSGLAARRRAAAAPRKSTKGSPTPLGADLPALRERVERLLGSDEGESEMYDMIRKDLLLNYMLEVQAGQDMEINPQHSRASRKQAKEIAELLIQLKRSDGS